jgi:shikimate dehydrogenase
MGFVRSVARKGFELEGARGSAIAAGLAVSGVAGLTMFDTNAENADALASRLRRHYPGSTYRPARAIRPDSTSW